MTEIPEHLLKRAQAAREQGRGRRDAPAEPRAAAEPAAAAAAEPAADADDSRIPAHLLERSRAAKAEGRGRCRRPAAAGGGGVAVADRVASVVQAAPTGAGVPVGAGPGGHTQRLLTVVKSGSIQDVKAHAGRQGAHLAAPARRRVRRRRSPALLFTFVFSIFVNAPLLQLANPNQTPNPSKAPWYFLGLQELLTMFHPMVAGVTIPGVGLILLIFAPYIDKNPSNKPEDRKFAISLMTIHMMFWAVLVIIGSFFRGPGFNFAFPWNDGLFFEL